MTARVHAVELVEAKLASEMNCFKSRIAQEQEQMEPCSSCSFQPSEMLVYKLMSLQSKVKKQ